MIKAIADNNDGQKMLIMVDHLIITKQARWMYIVPSNIHLVIKLNLNNAQPKKMEYNAQYLRFYVISDMTLKKKVIT